MGLGAMAQALVGHALVTRLFGTPVRLRHQRDLLKLLVVAGPLGCVVSASLGVSGLSMLTDVAGTNVLYNWLTWWAGDVFGVVVFMPLVLALPRSEALLIWRDRPVRGVHAISIALLALPLGLTFFAWKSLTESAQRHSQSRFETLANESEQAMTTRLSSYSSATRSGAGVIQSSVFVSREEWRTFTETLRLREDYPGMLGLGWIEHQPVAGGLPRDVVTYVEPELTNDADLGLDLSLEPRVREAADLAIRTAMPTLTRALRLRRGESIGPGYLLLQPVFRTDMPLDTEDARRRALRGYVYAPFFARGFWSELTPSQGRRLDVKLSEATGENRLVYDSRTARSAPQFHVEREIPLYGQVWVVSWQSTPFFEKSSQANGAYFVLFGGLLFTGMFAMLLVVFGARRQAERGELIEQPWTLPVATFVLLAAGGVAAYVLLQRADEAQVSALVDAEARRIESTLDRVSRARLHVVRRMAHRWSSHGATQFAAWRNDARDLVRQTDGLEELQWIGPDYRVHWAEGAHRNGWMENRDLRANERLLLGLAHSGERGSAFVTEPREFAPGESVFSVYVPVFRAGEFDGFLAATFMTRAFFRDVLEAERRFWVAVQYDGVPHFDNRERAADNPAWIREGSFQLSDRRWTFSVRPSAQFAHDSRSPLPLIVLVGALLIAALSAVLVRFVLVARQRGTGLTVSSEALKRSEERYELALRGMSVGLWDWNITTNAMFLSQRSKDILAVTSSDFVPKYSGFIGRLHPEDRPRVEKALFGHLKRQNDFDVEFRARRDDGEFVWLHVCGQALYDADGKADRMAGSMQDVTRRKQQDLDLAGSERKLRILIENVPAAVAMFDKDMRYILASNRYIQDFDLGHLHLIGMSHYDVFPELKGVARWVDVHQSALRGECFELREDSWTRADGTTEWHEWAIHPWQDAEGNVGGIILFTESTTARKQAEAAQRTVEAMNRAAMDKAPIGKALVSVEGKFIKVNPALCQLLGYGEDELLSMDFQNITHTEDLGSDLAHLRALLDGKTISYQMEKRYTHRDGRVVWAHLSVSAVRKAGGEIDFLVAQVQDITERKVIGQMKDELVSVVSHELHAPVTAIRDALHTALRESGALPGPLRQLLANSRAQCDRVAALVDNVLDLQTLTAGTLDLDFKDAPVAFVTEQAVLSNASMAREYGVNFVMGTIDPSIIVYVDPARYTQALSNLLSNAAKFSPSGSTVHVGAEVRGDWVRVFVRDHGAGIPEEFRTRIFSKFSHAEPMGSGEKGGAGLGLFVTRQLTEQMRGTIGFSSKVGDGTTFWLEFPRVSRDQRRAVAS
jgi:PAS domain S-box-containing protein